MKRFDLLRLLEILSPVIAVALSLLLASFVVWLIGRSPTTAMKALIVGSWGSANSISFTLYYVTTLIFTGLSVAFAFRCGLFNIGAEGQLLVGGIFGAWVAFSFHNLPWFVHIPLAVLSAAFAGALWGFVAGYLKVKRGVHEVITTIMMNWIAYALTNYLVNSVFRQQAQIVPRPQTPYISPLCSIKRIFPNVAYANYSFFLALFVAFLVYVVLWRTRFGYEIRATGLGPRAAEYGGINTERAMVSAMLISGAIAGMGSVNDILGYRLAFLDGFSGGAGFMGIAVALLGKNHPLGVVLAALLFGSLKAGGAEMQFEVNVPRELVEITQGVVIFFIVIVDEIVRRIVRAVRKKRGAIAYE